jgi:integrator complex subunit 1
VLPVQCLCEFLLNDSLNASSSVRDEDGSMVPVTAAAGNKSAKKQRKAGELLVHLQQLLQNPNSDPASCLETLDYFLRRLGSLQSPARLQALAGLKLLLTPEPQRAEEDRRPMEDDSGMKGGGGCFQSFYEVPG